MQATSWRTIQRVNNDRAMAMQLKKLHHHHHEEILSDTLRVYHTTMAQSNRSLAPAFPSPSLPPITRTALLSADNSPHRDSLSTQGGPAEAAVALLS